MRSRLPARLTALILVVTLALLAACGGDDDGGGDQASGNEATTAGDDDGTTTGATGTTAADAADGEGGAEGDSEVCDAAQRLSDLDDETQGVVNDSLSQVLAQANAGDEAAADAALADLLDEIRPFIDERMPDLVAAYDDLEATVPPDLAADVVTIRDFTVELVDAIADVSTVAELEAVVTERMETINVVSEAVLRLDQFTRDECGIVIAD